MTRRGRLTLIVVLIVPLVGVGMAKVGWILYTGGPYRGQVLDAETRQPLEGAVAFFKWDRRVYSLVEPKTRFLSAVEVLTDKEGRFHVPWFVGTSLTPFSIVLKPTWFVYYPGYKSEQVVVTPRTGISLKDPTLIFKRRILDREERLRSVNVLPGGVPDETMPNLIRLMNKERTALGLKPVHVLPGSGR
jgi:hypothetical protein